MNCKCYICGKVINDEHVFIVKFKSRNRIMCRKCGVKYRKQKYSKEGDLIHGDADRK